MLDSCGVCQVYIMVQVVHTHSDPGGNHAQVTILMSVLLMGALAMPGEQFMRALFSVWFGTHPPSGGLKEGMMGE